MTRKIIHLDMDYFFAQVEEKNNPTLKNKPFSVGSINEHRGVISTCNYIAREFGVHSAMSVRNALRKCPELILLPVRMEKYKHASSIIRDIFYSITDKVETLSLDEAYLDVSKVQTFSNSATLIAEWLQKEIYNKTGLTSSVGVASNKLLAKLASDFKKPNGITVIHPKNIDKFIADMPIKRINGVGKITYQKMQIMGITYCRDLQLFSREDLHRSFGKFGYSLYNYCRGKDDRKVTSKRTVKSISVEHTYQKDVNTITDCHQKIEVLYHDLLKRILTNKHSIGGVFIKITDQNFNKYSIERKSFCYELNYYKLLFDELYKKHSLPIRLLGLGVRLTKHESKQLSFDFPC